jgi:hypothetical protein
LLQRGATRPTDVREKACETDSKACVIRPAPRHFVFASLPAR